MTSDTQKAREWIENNYPGTCKNPDHKDWDCKIAIKGKEPEVLEAYAVHVTIQKDAEIAALRAQAEKDKERIVKLEEALKKSSPFAYRLLWLAFVWNDHNFGPAHTEARLTCEKHGIKSFDEGNAYLESVESALTPSTKRGED